MAPPGISWQQRCCLKNHHIALRDSIAINRSSLNIVGWKSTISCHAWNFFHTKVEHSKLFQDCLHYSQDPGSQQVRLEGEQTAKTSIQIHQRTSAEKFRSTTEGAAKFRRVRHDSKSFPSDLVSLWSYSIILLSYRFRIWRALCAT
jgi:hypothetical protein